MDVFRAETKVGLLVVASLSLLIAAVFLVSDIRSLWDDRRTVVLIFPYADGITVGSPVWYAGLEVGAVEDVHIAGEAADRIAVTARIKPAARVRKDSRTAIRSLGMMGAKYVEISPGSPGSPELSPGETLAGESPASLSEVMESGQQVARKLVDLVQETQGLIKEIRTEAPISEVVQNANGLVREVRAQARQLDGVVKKADSIATSLDDAGRNIRKVSGDGGKELTALVRELRDTNRGLQKRMETLETRLVKTIGKLDSGLTEAEGCATGAKTILTSSGGDLASFLKHLDESSKNLEMLSGDLREHPWKIVWKGDAESAPGTTQVGTEEWRDKRRIGPRVNQ